MNIQQRTKKLLHVGFYTSLACYFLGMEQLFFGFLVGLLSMFLAIAKYKDII